MLGFKKTLFLIFTIILLSSALYSTILNVPGSFPTIQVGIDATVDTDTVLVQPGTYFENIDFNGKNITVASLFHTTQDTSYISSTIIDGNSNYSVVRFHSGEDSTAVLSGFTITNGYNSSGGGISCTNGSPLLENLIITGNSATWGGGVGCTYLVSTPRLENVIIVGNSASHIGGGIHCANNSYPSLENVTISENTAVNYGGGGYISYADISCHNVTISDNIAYAYGGGMYLDYADIYMQNVTLSDNVGIIKGGGLFCETSDPILENVTISGNTSDAGGGVFCFASSNPSLINCIMWNDSPQEICFYDISNPNSIIIEYSDIEGGEAGIVTNGNGTVSWLDGNIDVDPLFVDTGNGYYHLQSTSPCIDAGDPTSQLDPDGTIADMGANYFHQSMNCEFTADVVSGMVPLEVTFTDLSQGYIEEWEWDFNNDGTLDSYEQNPTFIYNDVGVYSVSLTVSNSVLSDDLTIIDFITVNPVSGAVELHPLKTKLHSNHPNPFNPLTTIKFDIKENEIGVLKIFNIKGQLLESHQFEAGEHNLQWDASDMSSGVYLYKLQTGNTIANKKMLLLK